MYATYNKRSQDMGEKIRKNVTHNQEEKEINRNIPRNGRVVGIRSHVFKTAFIDMFTVLNENRGHNE